MIPRPLAMVIVVLVTVVWTANFFARLFIPGYEPDISINGIFMVLVGSLLLASRRRRGGDSQPDDELPDGVAAPPGLDQARRLAASYLSPDTTPRQHDGPRHRRDRQ